MSDVQSRAAAEVRVADLREGDEIWVDVLDQWMFIVGRAQGGYSEITLYMDDGPEDFLPLNFKRSEIVQCVRQPSLAQQLLEGAPDA